MATSQNPVAGSSTAPADGSSQDGKKKRIIKTLRACDNCRKQKMRCIGSDDPPCKRCRLANLECIFSRQPREPPQPMVDETRIKALETQMEFMGSTLREILDVVRHGAAPALGLAPTPAVPLPGFASLSASSSSSAALSFTSPATGSHSTGAPSWHPHSAEGLSGSEASFTPANPLVLPPLSMTSADRPPNGSARLPHLEVITGQAGVTDVRAHGTPLERVRPPVFSNDGAEEEEEEHEVDDDAPLDIQPSSLLAPLDSMASLAEAAAVASAQGSALDVEHHAEGAQPRGKRPPSTDGAARAGGGFTKRVRLEDGKRADFGAQSLAKRAGKAKEAPYVSCIQAGIVTEAEARELYSIFWSGADKFVAVFDETRDTFELHRDEKPFCLNAICYVASFIEDGGGGVSERQSKLWELVRQNAMETLFSKTSKVDAVQSLMLVAAWNEHGWLCGGHAVRLALDIGCHEAYSTLLQTGMGRGKSPAQLEDERDLVVKARVMFYLFNFEHQMAFGKGRPTIISVDESIVRCREFLQHPLAIVTDMKLVATTEIMTLRSRYIKQLIPQGEDTIDEETMTCIRNAHDDCERWYREWEVLYSRLLTSDKKVFYIESARVTKEYTQLFHNCVALRGVSTPGDTAKMAPAHRELASRAIRNAQEALKVCLNCKSYRTSFRYGVHHTFVTAAFAASFLIRMARLFPGELNLKQTAKDVEALARLLESAPAGRYGRSLRVTLRSARKLDVLPPPSAPASRPGSPPLAHAPLRTVPSSAALHPSSFPPSAPGHLLPSTIPGLEEEMLPAAYTPDVLHGADADAESAASSAGDGAFGLSRGLLESIGLELDADGQLPLWLQATNPGSSQLWSGGMEDFFLPNDIDLQLSSSMHTTTTASPFETSSNAFAPAASPTINPDGTPSTLLSAHGVGGGGDGAHWAWAG